MKKKLLTTLKRTFISGLILLMILPAMAQRPKKEISLLTQDQVKKITDIVKPYKEQIEKQLAKDDRYNSYVEDLKAIDAAKGVEEKNALTEKIKENYTGFFKEVWAAGRVDELPYQQRIRKVFPDNIGSLIQFDVFLNFTLLVSATTVKPAPPAPEPPPEDKCVDVCTITAGEVTGAAALIGSGGGSYGNCFLRTSAWGTGAFYYANSELNGWLRHTITIPGTFPNDARKLRVKKRYELRMEATSFAAIGGGFAETRIKTHQSSEYMLVFSPFIWGSHQVKIKTMIENYLLEKKDVANSQFFSNSNTTSIFGSGNWCFSDCSSIKWTICEEK